MFTKPIKYHLPPGNTFWISFEDEKIIPSRCQIQYHPETIGLLELDAF